MTWVIIDRTLRYLAAASRWETVPFWTATLDHARTFPSESAAETAMKAIFRQETIDKFGIQPMNLCGDKPRLMLETSTPAILEHIGNQLVEFGALLQTIAQELTDERCDCIASGNAEKPKQHGADPHAKNCNVYQKPWPPYYRARAEGIRDMEPGT